MSIPAAKLATRADLEGLPENVVGEVIEGVLYTFPRPRARHSRAATSAVAALQGPFDLWLIDIEARTLSASRNQSGRWLELGVWGEDDVVAIDPFDAIEIRFGDFWA